VTFILSHLSSDGIMPSGDSMLRGFLDDVRMLFPSLYGSTKTFVSTIGLQLVAIVGGAKNFVLQSPSKQFSGVALLANKERRGVMGM
jgi:hypothetical protein